MKTVITWMWLLPLPLTFLLELVTGTGPTLLADLLALALALPLLVRTQRRTLRGHDGDHAKALSIAAGILLLTLIPLAAASTMSLTVLWLSLVTLVMLARWFVTRTQLLALVLLSAANIVVPGLIDGDGLTFAFGASTVIVVGLALGLLLRMVDRSLIERHATAAEAERRRMATELHDLVAHEVTGIVVLSQAAARSEDLRVLTGALAKIEESGTRALDEIRSLVSNPPDSAGTRSPIASGVQSLRDRIAAFGDATSLTLDIDDTLAEVALPPVWPVLDRVLAEALTNVRRHAGPGVPITVRLARDVSARTGGGQGEVIVLTVSNAPGSAGIGTGSGSGLRGLRERVGHLGGDLFAGPTVEGRWLLEARIPLNPDNA